MSNHLREDRIQDYVDDLLCREERAEVEQHLAVCAVCQGEVAALRDLVADLHHVDAGVTPSRDLLAGINARIDAEGETRPQLLHSNSGFSDRSVRSMRYQLAAAAVILVALSAAITTIVMNRSAPAANVAQRNINTGIVANVANTPAQEQDALDRRYRDATSELEQLLEQQRSQLSPETVRLVEENLRVIDAALAEARAALHEDPNNAALTDLMRSAYEKKLDLLRHATQVRGTT